MDGRGIVSECERYLGGVVRGGILLRREGVEETLWFASLVVEEK